MPITSFTNFKVGKELEMVLADFRMKKAKLEEEKAQRSARQEAEPGGTTDDQMRGYITRTRKATRALIELMPKLTKVDEARLERAKNVNFEK